MKCVNYVVNCLSFALVFGCNPSPKNTKNRQEKPAFKQWENTRTHQHVALKTQEPHKHKEIAEVHRDIRSYYTLSYRNIVGYDTVISQLSICKNVFTLFVENPNLPDLNRFKDVGFPIEFWSTSMCAFYGVPVAQVTRYLKKAEALGYKRVGYDATLITEKDTSALIISNMLNVHLDRHTAQRDIHQVMSDVPGIRLEGGSLDYAFVVSVNSNRVSDIVGRFKVLKNHRLVKLVEFIPESCELLL